MDVSPWPLAVAYWVWTAVAASVYSQRMFTVTWIADSITSRPEGVELAYTDAMAAFCRQRGLPILEPLPLTPHLIGGRPYWRRKRRWIAFMPNGAADAIAAGSLEVRVAKLPAHTHLHVEDVGTLRKPRGGLKIPTLTMPTFSPGWRTPGFAYTH